MGIETCINYFEFLNTVCDRYLADQVITEEEMLQLKIEFDRFKMKVRESTLPKDLRKTVNAIQFNYTGNSSGDYYDLLGRFGFRAHKRHKLKKQVEAFKFEIKGLPMHIRLTYVLGNP